MAAAALRRDEVAAARWALQAQPPGPLVTLVRLFLLGDWCLAEDVDAEGATVILRVNTEVPAEVQTAIAEAVGAAKVVLVDLS